jgi:hypothetical protein
MKKNSTCSSLAVARGLSSHVRRHRRQLECRCDHGVCQTIWKQQISTPRPEQRGQWQWRSPGGRGAGWPPRFARTSPLVYSVVRIRQRPHAIPPHRQHRLPPSLHLILAPLAPPPIFLHSSRHTTRPRRPASAAPSPRCPPHNALPHNLPTEPTSPVLMAAFGPGGAGKGPRSQQKPTRECIRALPLLAGRPSPHLPSTRMLRARPFIRQHYPSPRLLSPQLTPLFCLSGPTRAPFSLCTRCQQVNRSEGSGGWAQEGRLAGCWAGEWLQRGCRMAASAGSRWQHACMAASANTRLLVVFVAVHVPLYSFLCKQVWDGAHPCWDAFTGLCVYIKSSSNQIKSSVTYDPKSSFYDTSPEQRQHINSKKCAQTDLMMWLMRVCP